MFSVKFLHQNFPHNKVITSGITFGFFEKDLLFEVQTEMIDAPLMFVFRVSRDKTRKPLEIVKSPITQDDSLTLVFYNPNEKGTSGFIAPLSLINIEQYILGFMFFVDTIPNSDCYRLSYEFYDGIIESSEGGAK